MDSRPAQCRFRLQDEGKGYPRSACAACGKTITTGLGTHCTVGKIVLDDLEITRDDIADIAAKRGRHLRRLIVVADEAVEHVRHRSECPGMTGSDDACTCGAVTYLGRLAAAIRNETQSEK